MPRRSLGLGLELARALAIAWQAIGWVAGGGLLGRTAWSGRHFKILSMPVL
jgi:hypothetical protein